MSRTLLRILALVSSFIICIFILRYVSYVSFYFSLLYFSSNRHTAFGIRFTDKPTARGLILPSFWHVLFVYGTLISVYIVVRSSCRVRFLRYALFYACDYLDFWSAIFSPCNSHSYNSSKTSRCNTICLQ